MNTLLLIVAGTAALGMAPWFGLMGLVVVAALRRPIERRTAAPPAGGTASRFLFVVPAHDESPVVAVTVRSCRAVDYDPERFAVLVIADNCTDDTAAVAAAAGALVQVRHDPSRRSKGYALEDFFRGAPGDPAIPPCDAYVLIDADTSVAPDLLRAFDQSLRRGDDFVQGYYTVRNAEVSWRTRLLTYAFSLANGVWLRGLDRLGLGVGLKGNGMCFRVAALSRFPWRAYGLVEDMEFAWNLRIAGERVRFQPAARVYGEMVSRGGAGAASQRRRWESGRQALRGTFRRSLWRSRETPWPTKIAYAIDLDFPPLSRLAAVLGIVSLLAGWGVVSHPLARSWVVIAFAIALDWAVLVGYLLAPIATMGLPARYLFSLIHLPYYMLWKLTVGLLKAPQSWVRTPREAGDPRASSH